MQMILISCWRIYCRWQHFVAPNNLDNPLEGYIGAADGLSMDKQGKFKYMGNATGP
jgi:hypothetical protein